MLKRPEKARLARNLRREKAIWHDADYSPSLGCKDCPQLKICGGLHVKAPLFNCLDYCCGKPSECDKVCRAHPDFVSRVREIDDFVFDSVPLATAPQSPSIPNVVARLYHSGRREQNLNADWIALSLYEMYDRRTGQPRFKAFGELHKKFKIDENTSVLLSGVDQDRSLERWWSLGKEGRLEIIRSFKKIGIKFVTSPNFSLFTDVPRWDDFHSMKRIAITHEEFLSEGIPAALHVNGRTDRDFERWIEYLNFHEEVTHIAYEFTTGTGWVDRKEQHVKWLLNLADKVDRPLHLTMRGGASVISSLQQGYANITVIESSAFMKSMKRQRASRVGNSRLGWFSNPTRSDERLDELLNDNIAEMSLFIKGQMKS